MTLTVTWLYVPGDRPERFAKAAASGADEIIIDLEDAVAPDHKDQARTNTLTYLESHPTIPVQVRINDLTTPRGRDDLTALTGAPALTAVRLPKVESPHTLDDLPLPAYALLESAAGILNAAAIAAHPRTTGIALGEQDLTAELTLTSPTALDHLRLQAVLAAAAAGLPPVPMSVYPDIRDEQGLITSCTAGRALGLFGRTAIHPRQIPPIRRAFRPTPEETTQARDIVHAAEQTGQAAFTLPDGRFVDAPILARARRTLTLADQLADTD
ncbi:HpcH/HpaI aldolase/citrate lyase family protein [Nonomuraea sp. NPDC050790]|uniref:HpcH/HpaI aldolase/citrate lyase family protein n=1 Tax=Nonomuraea sp. NPDC050790 TaxID=3364371 RepID=UPI00379C3001